jgi:AraC family transcriptional regulator
MKQPVEVKIKETRPMTVAFIAVTGPYSGIPAAFGKLYPWVMSKGYQPVGAAMAVYYTSPADTPEHQARWELRTELAGEVAPLTPDENGLGVKRVEGAQVAFALHKGPYQKIEAAYSAIFEWITANGYQISGPVEESYLNDPARTPPEELLTEIRIPVRKKQG